MTKKEEVIPTFQQLHNSAMQTVLLQLVLQLHESGTLDAQVLISRIESGQAFGQAAFRVAPNPVLPVLLQSLRDLLDALPPGSTPA